MTPPSPPGLIGLMNKTTLPRRFLQNRVTQCDGFHFLIAVLNLLKFLFHLESNFKCMVQNTLLNFSRNELEIIVLIIIIVIIVFILVKRSLKAFPDTSITWWCLCGVH